MLELVLPTDSAIGAFLDDAYLVTPLATEFRYPDEILAPDADQYAETLAAAGRLYAFCYSRVSEAAGSGDDG